MRIGILPVGKTDSDILSNIVEDLRMAFTETEIFIASEVVPVPEEAYSRTRKQYRSNTILDAIREFAEEERCDRVLGVADVDLFNPGMNFVFGQAECPGRVALISTFRLRPEFYKRTSNVRITIDRATKEAVHEIGHTLGLKHCPNPFCAMHFSNSVFETDRKQSFFCDKCYLMAQATAAESGKKID